MVQQEILEKNPTANLKIYTVWLNMLVGDNRTRWQSGAMPDPRVTHLWDENHSASEWFTQRVLGQSGRTYDVYFLYGPDAAWDNLSSPPTALISSGRTVLSKRGELEAGLLPLLK